jgi:hypothetical protein
MTGALQFQRSCPLPYRIVREARHTVPDFFLPPVIGGAESI